MTSARRFLSALACIGALLTATHPAQAQTYGPAAASYEGVLLNGGVPVTGQVAFTLRLLDGAGTCVIREESFAPTLGADGRFSLTLGQGTATSLNSALTLRQLMTNGTSISGAGSCAADTSTGKGRFLHVIANGIDLSPDVPIGSSPYAMVADTLQGKDASAFLAADAANQVTQTNAVSTFGYLHGGGGANWAELQALVSGASTRYLKPGANGASAVPKFTGSPSSPAQGQMWYDMTTNQLKYHDGSSVQTVGSAGGPGVTSIAAGMGLLGGAITTAGTLSVDVGSTAGKIVQLNGSAQLPPVSGALLTNLNATAITSGSLPIARGGTGLSAAGAMGEILVGSGMGSWTFLGCSTSGQVLTWNVGTGFGCGAAGGGASPSGSQGQLQMNSSGTFAGANAYWSGSGFGVGTSTPLVALEVAATGAMSAILVPRDSTANRPTIPVDGMIRYNNTLSKFEAYENGAWVNMIGGGPAMTTGTLSSGVVSTGTAGMFFAPSVAPGSTTAIGISHAISAGFAYSMSQGALIATKSDASFSGTGSVPELRGLDAVAEGKGPGVVATLRAIRGVALNSGGSSTAMAIGVEGSVQTGGSGGSTISTGYAFKASVPAGAAPVNNATGLAVSNVVASSTAYGVTVQGLSGTSAWGFYEMDPAPNYFQGGLKIGGASVQTNSVLDVSAGTAAMGIAPKFISLKAEDAHPSSTGPQAWGGDIVLQPGAPASGGSLGAVKINGPASFEGGAAVAKVDRVALSASACSPSGPLGAGAGVGCSTASYTLPTNASYTFFVCSGSNGGIPMNATGMAQGSPGASVNVALSGVLTSAGTAMATVSFQCMATSF